MPLTSEFKPLELGDLRREAAMMKADGWRFIQTHAVSADDGIDLYYSFMKDGHAVNYRIAGVTKDQPVPSITDLFLAAFVFENEARELFGVDMRDIAIDFHGAMYAPAQPEPMTFITPEQKAAKEKAAKIAAAKAAKESGAGEKSAKAEKTASPRAFVLSDEKRAQLEERLKTMSPEKVEKVRAALAAREAEATAGPAPEAVTNAEAKDAKAAADATRAAKEAPDAVREAPQARQVDSILEDKLSALDPEKAAKVRAAIAAKAAKDAGLPAEAVAADVAASDGAPSGLLADEQLDQLISNMDAEKAAKVRAALGSKGGE